MTFERGRSLHEIFLANGDRRIHKWVHYFDIYERHFRRFVDRQPTVLEIGVGGGGSPRMWREYFGDGAQIVGLDINPKKTQFADDGIDIVIGSQDDTAVLNQILSDYSLDIVIDDGSHQMAHIAATFDHLYERISPTGIYLVEDLHTCYEPSYGGGLGHEDSFLELTKRKVDELHDAHLNPDTPSLFARSTAAICIYDAIVVYERAPQGDRFPVVTTAMGRRPKGRRAPTPTRPEASLKPGP